MRYVVMLPLLLAACAPAAAATRSFPVGSFDRIESSGSWDVRVTVGPAPSAVATGEQHDLDRLSVTVQGGVLKVGSLPGQGWSWGWHSRKPTVVVVTVPSLRGASLTGSGGLDIDRVAAPSFDMSLQGSGDARIGALEAREVSLSLVGSGDLAAVGRAQRVRVAMRGSGDLRAGNLHVADAFVQATGSGDATLGATRSAQVMLTGSGDVTITGGARCDTVKHGSGDVRCR